MSSPIDIVILWVNDQDLKWREKKEYWQEKYGRINNQDERYRDWDNLHFIFRGIERFAPWVNHIYLVTDNQRPDWLVPEHSKVTLVDHTEIISDEYLPTFNSNSIELNIHRIKGLSEQFIYFNDDIFLINQTTPEDFFVDGQPKDLAVINLLQPSIDKLIQYFMFNDLSIINKEFNKHHQIKSAPFKWFNIKYGLTMLRTVMLYPWKDFTGFVNPHLAVSYRKKTFEEVWDKYDAELIKTVQSRFREKHNYNQWLMRYWQLASNSFSPRTAQFGENFKITDTASVNRCVSHIESQKSKMICINDNEFLDNFNHSKTEINNALEKLLAEKSTFEK